MQNFGFNGEEIGFSYARANVGYCKDPKCTECEQQFRDINCQMQPNLAYIKPDLDLKQAEKIIFTYAASIAADVGYLKAKIAAHGNTIINKWKKKSHQKRFDDLVKSPP